MKNTLHALSLILTQVLISTTLCGQCALKGTIVDNINGESLPGVEVRVKSHQARAVSDRNGYYEIQSLPCGMLASTSFSLIGYYDAVKLIELLPTETTIGLDVDIFFWSNTAIVIREDKNHEPIKDRDQPK